MSSPPPPFPPLPPPPPPPPHPRAECFPPPVACPPHPLPSLLLSTSSSTAVLKECDGGRRRRVSVYTVKGRGINQVVGGMILFYTGTSLGSSTSGGHRSHWCSVAYWEQRTRVGRLYPAYEPSLSIFYDLPQGTGLCLGQLHANAYHTRRDDPGSHGTSGLHGHPIHGAEGTAAAAAAAVQHPVFVHSPTLDPPSARGLSVKRVMPGFSLKMFDYERSNWMAEHDVKPESQEGPWDPHSVRISFAKGWGPCYSRQFITSCPCWLEVLLNNHR
ncbi:unnamed protein product [Pleuronectes platessa]|uniref:MH2 domain-containing protein n=1 Tax=Pleuronectes platessa TaxID=8262 RepID=A0A9N7ZDA7_PLEPL|nr:unnamed protein product [Pleuronectes platessa]